MKEKQNISLILTKDEALVLFEFLARLNQVEDPDIFEDQAEQKIFWNLEAQLENQLVEPFSSDYINLITEARNRIR